ncbi:MlaD family protein [Mycolicibacterium neoaurum]|uniref:MlaD family protein n=1 Tax=Mycolicibacterium neoaurum TaxID=1795 RepID=UPI0026731420|nr:MlaD family protein [Mycolicibacterium neoaurum]MDO3401773.1 MlaD family protein [Mycolicibacterium neoaurum]
MTTEAEDRRLMLIGGIALACVTAVTALLLISPVAGRETDRMSVSFEMPAVGQGITVGSPVMMYGVEVGKITEVLSRPEGALRLDAEVRRAPIADLTDTLGVDFRPANYFGVTGVNLTPGVGGQPLRDGMRIQTVSRGNYTLQALLTRLGEITEGVVTPQLISVIDRATRYTDGLNPLIETMVTAAETLTQVQTVSTEQLLRNATGISAAFPGFVQGATEAGYGFNQGSGFVTFNVSSESAMPGDFEQMVPGQHVSDEFWQNRSVKTLDLLANSLFGAVGKLLSSHPADLLPATGLIGMVSDTVPALVAPVGIAETTTELRTRLERMYAGSPEQRALQVRILLDKIPGVQAPVDALGGR